MGYNYNEPQLTNHPSKWISSFKPVLTKLHLYSTQNIIVYIYLTSFTDHQTHFISFASIQMNNSAIFSK